MQVKGTLFLRLGMLKEGSQLYEMCARLGDDLMSNAPAAIDFSCYFPMLRFVHYQLAHHYASARSYEEVVQNYEQVLAYTDDDRERQLILEEYDKSNRENNFQSNYTVSMVEAEIDAGVVYFKEKKYREALEKFEIAIQMARFTCPDRKLEGRALGNVATVHKSLRSYRRAIFNYRLSCRIFSRMGEKTMVRTVEQGS